MTRLHAPTLALAAALWAPAAPAADGPLLHCFYFTPVAEATAADWDAFYEATLELPSKIEGLRRVWAGKLSERAAVSQQVKLGREYGVCMEMADESALQRYAQHPAHDSWLELYEKVRVRGTTTFDILSR